MQRTLLHVSRLAFLAFIGTFGLLSCDRNSQDGILQRAPANAAFKGVVTPDKAYDEMFETTTNKLDEDTYLIITKAPRGSVFTVHTGPLPTPDHAVCYASNKNPGFRECVQDYYKTAGGVAVQSNVAGWWATPL